MEAQNVESQTAGQTTRVPSFVDQSRTSRFVKTKPALVRGWWIEVPSTYKAKDDQWFILTESGAEQLSKTVAENASPTRNKFGVLPHESSYDKIADSTAILAMKAISDLYNWAFANLDDSCFTQHNPKPGCTDWTSFVKDVPGTLPHELDLIFMPPPHGTVSTLTYYVDP